MTGIPERKKKTKMALLTVPLNAQLKSRAERRLNRMGMSGADAVEQLYRFIAEYGRMPMTERFVTEDAQPPVTVTRRKGGRGKSADREDCAGFVQRFLTFLSDRGVRCSNPEEFREKVLNCTEYEGVHRTVLMIMQHRAGLIANFFLP
jgi:addiction module antitoxin, RelB/DinJ family